MWDRTAAQPLTAAELGEFAACDAPAWGPWLKAVTADIELGCGEDWAVTALADRIRSPDRAAWLAQRMQAPATSPGARMRIAAALALAGHQPPDEPAWLFEALPPHRRALWILAATRSEAVASHTGPALATIALASRADLGHLDRAAALPALEWMTVVDQPAIEAEAVRIATHLVQGYPELVDEIRARRSSGRSLRSSVAAAPWTRTLLGHPECPPRCGLLWTEVLALEVSNESIEHGVPPGPDPVEHPRVAQLMATAEASLAERRALAYAVQVAADWVKVAPDPGERLRSLVSRPMQAGPSIPRIPWDGNGTPFATAVVVQAIGDLAGVDVEVRVGRLGDVWLRAGEVDVPRSCGGIGPVPQTAAWPPDAVLAAALIELATAAEARGDVLEGLRLATAAERLDPVVAGPMAVGLASRAPAEVTGGRRVGKSLLRPATTLTAAEPARRQLGEQGIPACPTAPATTGQVAPPDDVEEPRPN